VRIGIDAREITGQPTGVGRVLAGLLSAWPDDGDDEIFLYARSPVSWQSLDGRRRARVVPGPKRMPGAIWEQTTLSRQIRKDAIDAFFSPAYGMPLRATCGVVVGMHDCACEATPWEFGWRQRRRRQWVARRACRRAAFLLTGSRFAADEIDRWYGVPRDRVVVAPYGLDDTFRDLEPADIERARQRYGLTGRNVLFVGAPLGRRNLSGLSATIAELRRSRPDLGLCFVGPRPAAAETNGATETARWLGFVPDTDLPAIYAAATVVAYPSRYEGFGFPVLEALACGTPVVASRAGSLTEIFADRAWLVDDSSEQWSTALATLLDDPAERDRRVAAAQPWARRRRWGPAARLVRQLLHQAARNGAAGVR
jgi:glycosyltransferase involved in cell wall biosynthesis